jgi:hypothetical protein
VRHDRFAFLAVTVLGLFPATSAGAQDQSADDGLSSARAQLKEGQPKQAVESLKALLDDLESGDAREQERRSRPARPTMRSRPSSRWPRAATPPCCSRPAAPTRPTPS